MSSGKKNPAVQGFTQLRHTTHESIDSGEIWNFHLNANILGQGLAFDQNNAITLSGLNIISTTAGLISALNSNAAGILLVNGTYQIPGNLNISGSAQITGQSQNGVIIQLQNSGVLNSTPTSGTVLSGNATLNISNPGVVFISGQISGQLPLLSWQGGASIILDEIPYRVLRVSSGEVSGVAQIQLSEVWTGSTGFISKPYQLMYFNDSVALQNLTIQGASLSGILNFKRNRNLVLQNLTVESSQAPTTATSGIDLSQVYYAWINNVTVQQTQNSVGLFDQYAIQMADVHEAAIDDCQFSALGSNGVLIQNSTNIHASHNRFNNVEGRLYDILQSNRIYVDGNKARNIQFGSRIYGSDQVQFRENYISTLQNTFAVDIQQGATRVHIDSNQFDGSVASFIPININQSRARIIANSFSGSIGIQATSGSVLTSFLNTFNTTTGISFDSSISGSIIDANTFNCTTALAISGTANSFGYNAIMAGVVSLANGNNFYFTPFTTGINLGSPTLPLFDGYFADAVYLSGFPLTTNASGVLFVGGVQVTSSSQVAALSGSIYTSGGSVVQSGGIYIQGHQVQATGPGALTVDGVAITGSGGGGSGTIQSFDFTQSSPSTVWTINHGLNTNFVSVTLYDASGFIFLPYSAISTTPNQVTVTFTSAQTGKALIIGDISSSATQLPTVQYVHTQAVAATTWTVTHNQNSTNFDVTCFDSSVGSGTVFLPLAINIVDANNVQITNSIATAGKAVFIFATATPVVASGALEYVHTQTFASTTWNINHTLSSTNYVITIFDNSGNVVIPDNIQTISSSVVQVTWSYPATGTATLVGKAPSVSNVQQSQYKFTQAVAAQQWVIAHNLNTQDFVVQTFDNSGNMFIPSGVVILDSNNIRIDNTTARAGKAILEFQNATINAATSGAIFVWSQATNSTIWTVNHAQNSSNYIINTYDQSGNLFIPVNIKTIDANTVQITNNSSISGTAVLAFRTGTTASAPPQNMYVYTQTVAATTWTIGHNLNTSNYSITLFDVSGNVYLPNTIQTLSNNSIQITNAVPKAGKAVIIFQNATISPVNQNQFTFIQGTAASTWNIIHNLNTTSFNISMFDLSGNYFLPDGIQIIDANNVKVTSVSPIAGSAILTFQNANVGTFVPGTPFEQRFVVASGVIQSTFALNKFLPLTFINGVDQGKQYQVFLDGTGALLLDTNNTAGDNDYTEVSVTGTNAFNSITLHSAIVGPANLIVWAPGAYDSSSFSASQIASNTSAINTRYGSYVRYDTIGTTTTGWGSTKTKVARFTNVVTKGGDLSYTQSTINGDLITVNTAGGYLIEGLIVLDNSGTSPVLVITKNTSDAGTSDPLGTQINGTIARAGAGNPGTNTGGGVPASKVVDLVVGDILRLHGRGTAQAFNSEAYFNVTRVY